MSKKKNNRILLIILVVLVAIVAALEFIGDEENERTFDKDLVAVDTLMLNTIEINGPASEGSQSTVLNRQGGIWSIRNGNESYIADQQIIENLIKQSSSLESIRVVAIDESRWQEYQVGDSLGKHVVMKNGDEVLADFYVGRFNFDQKTRQPRSYVRLAGKKETHLVEGMLGMVFEGDPNYYRSKTISELIPTDISRVQFSGLADDAFLLQKQDGAWLLNGNAADSSVVEDYLNNLAKLRSDKFAAVAKPELAVPTATLRVEGANMSALNLELYMPDTSTIYLTSSAHPDGVFDAKAGGLMDKILFE